jgi:uncharacterized protein YutE (UPF0331/DUF86 family)
VADDQGDGEDGQAEHRPRPPLRIRTRLADTPRHYKALGYALSTFTDGEGYLAAATSTDPVELGRAYTVERPFELLENYVIELARAGLEEAKVTADEMTGRQALRALADQQVISNALRDRLIEIHDLRNQLAHDYPDIKAQKLYEAACALEALLQEFMRRYLRWLDTLGFAVPRVA